MRILDIVDSQVGFMHPKGSLYVAGAEGVVPLINRFFRQTLAGAYDLALVKYDTHLDETYHLSPESRMFPLHCQYHTADWRLAVDVDLLTCETFFMAKETFDMWGGVTHNGNAAEIASHYQQQHAVALSHTSATAYQNINRICGDPLCLKPITTRDEFFCQISERLGNNSSTANSAGESAIRSNTPNLSGLEVHLPNLSGLEVHLPNLSGLEVHLIGVASDYCNRFAMEGYLTRGAKVVVLEDLTKGISLETQNIIAEQKYAQYVATGQLSCTSSRNALR